jgi:glycerol-3-phosphate dehydrogenase
VDEIAGIVAPMLGWSPEQTQAEIDAYRRWTEAELKAIDERDDRTAAQIRAGVDDLVPMINS